MRTASQVAVERREYEIRGYRRKIRNLFVNSFGMNIDQVVRDISKIIF